MIDSLLWAFGASDEDEAEVREFAKKKRTIKDDVPLADLSAEDRELLLAHAALLTHADGKQTKGEEKLSGVLTQIECVQGKGEASCPEGQFLLCWGSRSKSLEMWGNNRPTRFSQGVQKRRKPFRLTARSD